MDLSNPFEVVLHYILFGGMNGLSHWDGFFMVSALVYMNYTLNKTYDESWCKAIELSWFHQAIILYFLSTLRKYWGCAKVSNDFDLWMRS